jgi:hypothetical protein
MYIGTMRHNINVSEEYYQLAKKDEEVAKLLKENKQYRHAMYFFIQSMEKYIRSRIFILVNPNIEYFREKNKHHSINEAVEFLVEIVSSDPAIQKQIKQQLSDFVFQNINFQNLHNNLRYPFYFHKRKSYVSLDFKQKDCEIIEQKLDSLKNYLSGLSIL